MRDHILVATDGSEQADKAVAMAALLSGALRLQVHIAHVLMHARPGEDWLRMAEIEHLIDTGDHAGPDALATSRAEMLTLLSRADDDARAAQAVAAMGTQILERARSKAAAAGAHGGTEGIRLFTCHGDTADEILDLAEADPPEMIVLGHRGLGRLRRVILGSVSQKVLHHAVCPVLIVP